MKLGKSLVCSLVAAGLFGAVGAAAAEDLFGDLFRSNTQELVPSGPPKDRMQIQGHRRSVTAIHGDTFASLAESIYGDAGYWRLLYWANKSKLPNPNDPNSLFAPGERMKQLTVPPPSHINPAYKLELKGPEDIGEKEARTIMEATGLLTGKRSFPGAIRGLKYGYTYTNKKGTLNDEAREYLYREWTLLKKALDKYPDHPDISQEETPELFEGWLRSAAKELQGVRGVSNGYALLKSLMTQETGRSHWVGFTPVMGSSNDTGFGQILPATAKLVGINPYDPGDNIRGIALHLKELVKQYGLRNGLARYNGGNSPPASSYRYADAIIRRMVRYSK